MLASDSICGKWTQRRGGVNKLEFMFMKHYAPNRCGPSIEALNFGGGGGEGGIRAYVNGEVNFFLFIFFLGGGGQVGGGGGGGGGVGLVGQGRCEQK